MMAKAGKLLSGCACCGTPARFGATGVSRRGFLAGGAAAVAATAIPATPTLAQAKRRIDVHHHIIPPMQAEALIKHRGGNPAKWSVQMSLEDMDKAGVATSITSVQNPGVWFGQVDEESRKLARECNEYAKKLEQNHPGRFRTFAVIPLPDTEGSLREIEYALDVLKADGIGFMTSYGDKWPGDPMFAPVFAELNRRKAIAYFHPLAPNCCGGTVVPTLIPTVTGSPIEYVFDTTRAVVSLLVGGTLAKMKDMRFLFSHAGGTIPMVAGRIANALRTRKDIAEIAPDGIDAELRKLYYDTANSFYAPTIAALTSYVPGTQILFGTDFPYLTIGQNLDGLRKLGLSAEQMAAITRDNGARLLKRS
jgi:predicted TIM-barrel fold metal-dependent hydrolase